MNRSKTDTWDSYLLPTQMSALVVRFCSERGIPAAEVLKGTGLSVEDLHLDDSWISYQQTMQIIENAYRSSGRETLGLEIGSAESLATYGILGYAMLCCENLGQAIEIVLKYHRTAQSLMLMDLTKEGDNVLFSAAMPFIVSTEQHRFAVEELFSGFLKVIFQITGQAITPREVHCAYAEPTYAAQYREVFNCPVYFDRPASQIVFISQHMCAQVLHAQKFNAAMSEKLCQQILNTYVPEESLSMQIRQFIIRSHGHIPKEKEVAEFFHVSPRTLRRNLEDEGTTYTKILEQLRIDLAKEYLQNTTMSIERIAQLLGYAETNNFRRAFKRLQGLSPREYRAGRRD